MQLTDLYPGMTYTLRIYSRDNEGISSAIITFMTSTGERGSGLAVPYKHGHFILILSFLLEFAARKKDPSHPFPTLHGVSQLLYSAAPDQTREAKMHAQWRDRCASNPVGTRGTATCLPHCARSKGAWCVRARGPRGWVWNCWRAAQPSPGTQAGFLHTGLGAGSSRRALPQEFPQQPSERSACRSLPCHSHLLLKNSKVCLL